MSSFQEIKPLMARVHMLHPGGCLNHEAFLLEAVSPEEIFHPVNPATIVRSEIVAGGELCKELKAMTDRCGLEFVSLRRSGSRIFCLTFGRERQYWAVACEIREVSCWPEMDAYDAIVFMLHEWLELNPDG